MLEQTPFVLDPNIKGLMMLSVRDKGEDSTCMPVEINGRRMQDTETNEYRTDLEFVWINCESFMAKVEESHTKLTIEDICTEAYEHWKEKHNDDYERHNGGPGNDG